MLKININYIRRSKTKKPLKNIKQGSSRQREGEKGKKERGSWQKTLLKFVLLQTFNAICVFVPTNVVCLLCLCVSAGEGEAKEAIKSEEKRGEQNKRRNMTETSGQAERELYAL